MDATYGSTKSRYTVWHFIGCGCTVLVLAGLLVAGGVIFVGKHVFDGMRAGIEDPEVRAARVKEVLGCEELPEGYYPGISISIPFAMEMASMGDKELPNTEGMDREEMEGEIARAFFGRNGFLYFKIRSGGSDRSREEMTREMNIDMDVSVRRELANGTVEAGGGEVTYVAHLGHVGRQGDQLLAIINEMVITCLESPYARKALWFEGVSEELDGRLSPTEPIVEEDLVGSPADPEAVKAFLDHFDLCR